MSLVFFFLGGAIFPSAGISLGRVFLLQKGQYAGMPSDPGRRRQRNARTIGPLLDQLNMAKRELVSSLSPVSTSGRTAGCITIRPQLFRLGICQLFVPALDWKFAYGGL